MEYRPIKVCYKSKVDWQQYLDYIYCSPHFHGKERCDFIMLKTADSFIFARLAFIFTCAVAEQDYVICLAWPLDSPTGQWQSKDEELRLHHLHEKSSMEFFFVGSIVHGAPLIQDFAKSGDYFMMDVIDHTGDMFLCCNEIFPQ